MGLRDVLLSPFVLWILHDPERTDTRIHYTRHITLHDAATSMQTALVRAPASHERKTEAPTTATKAFVLDLTEGAAAQGGNRAEQEQQQQLLVESATDAAMEQPLEVMHWAE